MLELINKKLYRHLWCNHINITIWLTIGNNLPQVSLDKEGKEGRKGSYIDLSLCRAPRQGLL